MPKLDPYLFLYLKVRKYNLFSLIHAHTKFFSSWNTYFMGTDFALFISVFNIMNKKHITIRQKTLYLPLSSVWQKMWVKFRYIAGIITAENMLTKDANKIIDKVEFTDPTLREYAIKIMEAFKESMVEKGTSKIDIKNGDNEPVQNGTHSYVTEDSFFKIFRSLAEKLSKRTIYKLDLDKDKFITACIEEIDSLLLYRKVKNQYEIDSAGVKTDDSGRIIVGDSKTQALNSYAKDDILQKSDFEIANTIMYHTKLPRFAIFRILLGIQKKILLSNQDILDLVIKRINYKLNEAKAESLQSYEVINGYEFDDKVVFEADNIDEEMLESEKKVYQTKESEHRAVNRYYRVDSDGEYDFAAALDEDDNVLMFTKIKKGGFVISTPYGNYTPDWALVYKQPSGDIRLYFIVETKFEKEWKDLADVEQLKIRCGTLHFEAVDKTSNQKVRFGWANCYEDFESKARAL